MLMVQNQTADYTYLPCEYISARLLLHTHVPSVKKYSPLCRGRKTINKLIIKYIRVLHKVVHYFVSYDHEKSIKVNNLL